MRLKVEEVGSGLHPREIFVKVATLQGPQELLVDSRSLREGSIDVGQPIAQHDNRVFLVELPTETSSGAWRVWVDDSVIVRDAMEAAE